MKHIGPAVKSVALTIALLSLDGCGEWERPGAQRDQAAGWRQKLFSTRMTIPVETGVTSGVAVEYVSVWQHSGTVCVSGTVRPMTLGAIHPQAHVDVVLVDDSGKKRESQTTKWLPRAFPTGPHSVGHRSRFAVRLKTSPLADEKVRVIFHNASIDECKNEDGQKRRRDQLTGVPLER